MTHSHQMTDVAQIKTFVRGGNSRFTLVSKKTGTRFTYKVRASEDGKVHFVKFLSGPDNVNAYTFLGTIFADGSFRLTSRNSITAQTPSAVAFTWFFDAIASAQVPAQLEFWHEGRCGRCGRVLTVPESIATGFGPECAGMVGAVLPSNYTTRTDDRAEFVGPGPGWKGVPARLAQLDLTPIDATEAQREVDEEEAEFTRQIQEREQDEERRRMDRKFGLDSTAGNSFNGWRS